MSEKCALIVDDSRSARVFLERMLTAHALQVDSADSAEAALEYLAEHRPDVIFMDHMMPGMDGFEAVQAIKDNPATATIPIMMYTSQEGELYVGQARALGAVGVLPKQIEPVEVSRVLQSLRLIPGVERETLPAENRDIGDTAQIERLVADDVELRELIKSMFEQQRSVLRRDLLDSYEAIAARVAEEIAPDEDEDEIAPSGKLSAISGTALVLLGLAALTFAYLYWQAESRWQQESGARSELADKLIESQRLSADGTLAMQASLSESQNQLNATYDEALSLIQWALNDKAQYRWNETALGDNLALQMEELIRRLDAIGFVGTILVQTHVGEFCVASDAQGDAVLPPADSAITACNQIGQSPASAEQAGSEQSVAFANLLETAGERTDGRISLGVSTLGNSEPRFGYPPLTEDLTVGDWNQIAARNHRIELELINGP